MILIHSQKMMPRAGAVTLWVLLALWLSIASTEPVSAAFLDGSVEVPAPSVDLSAEGVTDWAHWGLTSASSFNHKAGVASQISNYTLIGSGGDRFTSTRIVGYSWSGGTPTASVTGTQTGLYFSRVGNGFRLTVPAGVEERTVRVHVGGWRADGRLQASLSDGSAPPYQVVLSNPSDIFDRVVTLSYSSASSGANLVIEYVVTNDYGVNGNVTLKAVTLNASMTQTVATPVISPSAGTYTDSVEVSIQTATAGADIYYTLDGSEPTTGSDLYAGPFLLTESATVKAKAFLTGYDDSGVASSGFVVIPSSGDAYLDGSVEVPAPSVNLSDEGVTDWAHWGLTSASSFNHKAGVSQQISHYTLIGSQGGLRFSSTRKVGYSWNGGTPTASVTGTQTGLYFPRVGNGYRLTVPAGVEERTVRVHLGGWRADGRLQATLSDGSAPPYQVVMSNPSDIFDRVVTLNYSAASSGANLVIEYVVTNDYGVPGNITLQAVTLTAFVTPAVATPVISPAGGTYVSSVELSIQTATAGATIHYTLNGSEPTVASPIYGGPFILTSSATVKAKAFLAGYNDSNTASSNFVIVSAASGQVTGSVVVSPAQVNLSTEGLTDWAHWGLTSASSFNHKAGVVSQISNYTLIGSGGNRFTSTRIARYSWSGGTPTASVTGTQTGLYFSRIGNGFRLTVPAGVDERTVRVHVGGWRADGRLQATLSDGSAPPYQVVMSNPSDIFDRVVTLNYSASSPDANLVIEYVVINDYGVSGNVTLKAATLNASVTPTVATPVISPSAGTYTDSVEVSIRTATAGADIYYTVDGSEPTQSSMTYSSPFILTSSATVKAKAFLAGFEESATASNDFVVEATLPHFEDFSGGTAPDWVVVNNTNKSPQWVVASGAYSQTKRVESTASFSGSYHLGTYSYLSSGLGYADYELMVDATFVGQNLDDDLGVLFRYRDDDNYYRLTLNGRYGFCRLEKKSGGAFSTLGVNARGYRRGQTYHIMIQVSGRVIQVYLDGASVFSVSDQSHLRGSIALYCQDYSKFDNVLIQEVDAAPSVAVSQPLSFSVSSGSDLSASAQITGGVTEGQWVEFLLDGIDSIPDHSNPFMVQFTDVVSGEHTVEAVLHDDTGEIDSDGHQTVGVGGDYYIAVGDSITNGSVDKYKADNISSDLRNISSQGFHAVLNDLLTESFAYPHIIFNEGIGGDDSYEATTLRISSILERHPSSNKVLVLLGTNDGAGLVPVTANAFRQNMQALINQIPAGKSIWVGLVPPNFSSADPLADPRNDLIREYNAVIMNDLTGINVGPDFFSFFLNDSVNRFSLFSDSLHPNSLGHLIMAHLWYNTLAGESGIPLFVDDLSPSTYKQTLLEAGNPYYVDGASLLTGIPEELRGGVWIMTANADKVRTDAEFLSFVVDRPVDLYVAYDSAAAQLPAWLAPFTPTGLQVLTNDSVVPSFNVYRLPNVTGAVSLGGNLASPASGALGNYLVILKEN